MKKNYTILLTLSNGEYFGAKCTNFCSALAIADAINIYFKIYNPYTISITSINCEEVK